MEDEMGIIKDMKPYLVFKCGKCEQYMYVKPSQKTKKCLRCGKNYKVSKLHIVDEVKGMSAAVKHVKELQNGLAEEPNLSGVGEFSVASEPFSLETIEENLNGNESTTRFYDLLMRLSEHHKKFPKYLIDILAAEYRIKKQEVPILINHFMRNGVLKLIDHNYYALT